MRKIFGVLLSVLCICCAAIGLTGCKKDKHIHAFDKQVITDEYKATDATCTEAATYYYSCECGEKGTETFTSGNALGHSFTNYVSDNNATCTQDGTKTAVCDRDGCNAKDTVADEGSKLPHTFDKKVANEKYLASAATCTESAKYYYSCSCGEKGTETFEYGSSLGHSFTNYVSDHNATCTEDGTKTAKCDRCDKKNTVKDIDSKLHHSYTEQIVSDEYLAVPATCNKKATYYYSCKCGATGIETFEYGSTTDHNFVNGRCTYCGKEQEASKGLAFTLLNDGTYEVSGIGSCTDTEIVIPSVYNDKPVTFIGEHAFSGYNLTSVIIPDTVTTIGWGAFESCSELISVTIPGSVTTIGYVAFGGSGLTSVTIEKGVSHIGSGAFTSCVRLLSVTIPDSVETIAEGAFFYCLKLVEVINNSNLDIVKGNREYGDIGSYALNIKKGGATDIVNKNNFLFYTSENVNYLLDYIGKDSDLTLPSDYNGQSYQIYDYAFAVRNELARIAIPDKVTSIGYAAFMGCSGVESIIVSAGNTAYSSINNCLIDTASGTLIFGCKNSVIPNVRSITAIGDGAFSDCSGLTSVTIPDSVTSIGYGAFAGCSGLTSVTIPDSVTTIGESAFSGCSGLTSVTIPDSVTTIGESAFSGCSGLTSVTIPDSVTTIGESAFSGCSGLTSVTIGNGVASILDRAFSGCSRLTNINISSIESWCKINGLRNLMSDTSCNKKLYINEEEITELIIPDSVTYIGSFAFYNCNGLTDIILSDNITYIGNCVFAGCEELKNVSIGNGVTSIGAGAFAGCGKLKYNEYDNAYYLGNDDNPYYALIEAKDTAITSCKIVNEKTKLIASQAFGDCRQLSEITIPDSVLYIDSEVFRDCRGLTDIRIPDSVVDIRDKAFMLCTSLTNLTIGNGVKSIGYAAFAGCVELANVTIPNGVVNIGDCAFSGCDKLANIVISESLNHIGSYAFGGIACVDEWMFDGCRNLISISFTGTIADWKNITKGIDWNYAVPSTCVIHCTDGDIKISD